MTALLVVGWLVVAFIVACAMASSYPYESPAAFGVIGLFWPLIPVLGAALLPLFAFGWSARWVARRIGGRR